MGTTPPQPPSPPRFSPDRRWRWTGHEWVPNQPPADGTGAAILGVAIGFVLVEVFVLVVVSVIVIAILLAGASQIVNVFSNVQAALGG